VKKKKDANLSKLKTSGKEEETYRAALLKVKS
jgi:hypothetical protein